MPTIRVYYIYNIILEYLPSVISQETRFFNYSNLQSLYSIQWLHGSQQQLYTSESTPPFVSTMDL